jgi:ribosomal protein S17E
MRAAIKDESDENACYNMARLLAQTVKKFPENLDILQELLRVEQSKRIRQHIAETLTVKN